MNNPKSRFFLSMLALAVCIAGFWVWRSLPQLRERRIRLTLKPGGCDKARAAGMLPAPGTEGESEKICRTVVFGYRGYINDDPLKISYGEKRIEFPSSEIGVIEINPEQK